MNTKQIDAVKIVIVLKRLYCCDFIETTNQYISTYFKQRDIEIVSHPKNICNVAQKYLKSAQDNVSWVVNTLEIVFSKLIQYIENKLNVSICRALYDLSI